MLRAGVIVAALILAGCTQSMGEREKLIFPDPVYAEVAGAACRGDTEALRSLVTERIDLNFESKDTQTPWGRDTLTLLTWAVVCQSPSGARALLEAGVSPNKTTRRGMSPLMLSATQARADLFNLILEGRKADPNLVFDRSETALTLILQARQSLGGARFERAGRLVAGGAHVNLNLDRGDTALSNLGRVGDWRAVHWLLEHGADHGLRDSVNATITCSVRRSYRVGALAPSEAYTYRDKVKELLLQRGVELSKVEPALHPDPKCDD